MNKVLTQESATLPFSHQQAERSPSPMPIIEDEIVSPVVNGPDVADVIPLGGTPRQSVISYGGNAKIFEFDDDDDDDLLPQAAGPSRPKTRLLNFNINYQDRNIPMVIPDSESVGMYRTFKFTIFHYFVVTVDQQFVVYRYSCNQNSVVHRTWNSSVQARIKWMEELQTSIRSRE